MICPNCKTELVEVNGRYICSDCGREIPENEVMASDWGNGGATRAGLYGAGTDDIPEVGSEPINDYSTSLTEAEGELQPPTKLPVDTEVADEPSVEEILQQQGSTEAAAEAIPSDPGFYEPTIQEQVENNSLQSSADEIVTEMPEPELEFSTSAAIPVLEVPAVEPVVALSNTSEEVTNPPVSIPEISMPTVEEPVVAPLTSEPEVTPTFAAPVTPVTPELPVSETPTYIEPVFTPEVQEIPVNVPVPEVAPPEQVVTDMFEASPVVMPQQNMDPGIYTDPSFENNLGEVLAAQASVGQNIPMPADRRVTLIVLISGILLIILLIIGGTWGYLALNKSVAPVTPVVDNPEIVWQEFKEETGGFKLSFPGTPVQTEEKMQVNGFEKDGFTNIYTDDSSIYSLRYAYLSVPEEIDLSKNFSNKALTLLKEIADPLSLTVSDTKIGKYYTADAIDFVLNDDTAKYQGKLMIQGSRYIVLMAGSSSGQSVEYSKFIKSFNFITAESTQ